MKPEKMMDEQVSVALSRLEAQWPLHSAGLRAHIAALEAERDEWKTRAESRQEEIERQMAERQREWQGKQREAEAYQRERDALRERVQALEAELEQERAECERASDSDDDHWRRLQEAESRLAAIRQRAGDVGELLSAWESSNGSRFSIAQKLESVARFIVGDASDAQGNCAEPTTAEAFATVRELTEDLSEGQEDQPGWRVMRKQLSLLERRMGAMVRAGTRVCESVQAWADDLPGPAGGEVIDELHAALTDAPPVFTLEEVDKALTRAGVSNVNARDVLSVLRQ